MEAAHLDELEKTKESVTLQAKAEAEKTIKDKLLALSRFLRAAAAKRQDGDETAEGNRAFEGALLLIYGGDSSAVEAMEKLIDGSEDLVPTVEGQPSGFTCETFSTAALRSFLTRAQTSTYETLRPTAPPLLTLRKKLGLRTSPPRPSLLQDRLSRKNQQYLSKLMQHLPMPA